MAATHFTGPVHSTNGFVGSLTVADPFTATDATITNATITAATCTTASASTSLTVGGGTAITKILKGTVSVTVGTNAAAAEADVTLTITGAEPGDAVILTPTDAAAETGLCIAAVWVSASDTVKARFSNLNAAAALSGSTANWTYLVIKS